MANRYIVQTSATIAILIFIALALPKSTQANVRNDSPTSDHNEIVVIGKKAQQARIETFIKSTVRVSGNQYARFSASICPVAMGFSEAYNQVIVQRIKEVTKAAEIGTGGEGCKPNMAIVAMKKSRDFIGDLRKKHPNVFGTMSIPARDRLMAGPGPAYVWNTIYAIGSGGAKGNAAGGANSSSDGFGSGGAGRMVKGTSSRIVSPVEMDISMAVLVVEKPALLGMNLRQIADYSAMRLLVNSNRSVDQKVTEHSILSLFSDKSEGATPPESLTEWDLALLKSLYSTRVNVYAPMQRGQMMAIFERELKSILAENDSE